MQDIKKITIKNNLREIINKGIRPSQIPFIKEEITKLGLKNGDQATISFLLLYRRYRELIFLINTL